jgi:hypothetical protein
VATLRIRIKRIGGDAPLGVSLRVVVTTSDGTYIDTATHTHLGGPKALADGAVWSPPDLTAPEVVPEGALYKLTSDAKSAIGAREWYWDGHDDAYLSDLPTEAVTTSPPGWVSIGEAMEEARDEAEAAQAAAELAETNAETAETNAETAQAASEVARAGAETARTGAETARTGAETAQTAAELAETHAETAETNAETAETSAAGSALSASGSAVASQTARTGSEAARDASVAARDAAVVARTGAETAETNAETAETNAETAETNAETAQAAAVVARTGAETARTGAETARTGAETARTGAETAQTAAAASAAGISMPNGFPTILTNLAKNPIFGVDTSEWGATAGTLTRTGPGVARFAATAAAGNVALHLQGTATRFPVTAGKFITAGIRVTALRACSLGVRLFVADSGGSQINPAVNTQTFALAAGETRVVGISDYSVGTGGVTAYFRTSAAEPTGGVAVITDYFDVTAGAAYVTDEPMGWEPANIPMTDGTQPGSMWTGTAHASTTIVKSLSMGTGSGLFGWEAGQTVQRTNYCPRPSMEVSGGWAAAANATIATTTADKYAATQSLLVSKPTTASSGISASVACPGLTIGATYIYSAYVKRQAGIAGISLGQPGTLVDASRSYSATPTAWTRLWVTFVATATSHTITAFAASAINTGSAEAGENFYLDAVMIEQVDPDIRVPSEYFDGSQPGCRWQGVAHGSISELLVVRSANLRVPMDSHEFETDPHPQYAVENVSDPALHGLKDFREVKLTGLSGATNKSGALIVPITMNGNSMLTAEVELHAYSTAYVRAKIQASVYYRETASGAMLSAHASYATTTKHSSAITALGASWPKVRWVRSSTVGLVYLVIGDIADTVLLGQAEVLRVTSAYTAGALISVGTPSWVTTLPANDQIADCLLSDASGDMTGTGSPEGVIIAPPGQIYVDKSSTGLGRWKKLTGTSSAGWAPEDDQVDGANLVVRQRPVTSPDAILAGRSGMAVAEIPCVPGTIIQVEFQTTTYASGYPCVNKFSASVFFVSTSNLSQPVATILPSADINNAHRLPRLQAAVKPDGLALYIIVGSVGDSVPYGECVVTSVLSTYMPSMASAPGRALVTWATSIPTNIRIQDFVLKDLSGDRWGTGSPEGVVLAPPGTRYRDTAKTNGAAVWRKDSAGTLNTGWVCVEGDTLHRNITTLLHANAAGQSTETRLRRTAAGVHFGIGATTTTWTSGDIILTIPTGSRTSTNGMYLNDGYGGSTFFMDGSGGVRAYPGGSAGRRGNYFWLCDEPWPISLPGTAIAAGL